MTFGIITAVVASLALAISAVQFLNRHRPYVCVTRLFVMVNQGEFMVEVELDNLGEIPAKGLFLKATQPESAQGHNDESVTERPMGAIFPKQKLRTFLQVPTQAQQALDQGVEIPIIVDLFYRSSFSFRLWFLRYGAHTTYQPLFVDQQGWGASAGGSANFS